MKISNKQPAIDFASKMINAQIKHLLGIDLDYTVNFIYKVTPQAEVLFTSQDDVPEEDTSDLSKLDLGTRVFGFNLISNTLTMYVRVEPEDEFPSNPLMEVHMAQVANINHIQTLRRDCMMLAFTGAYDIEEVHKIKVYTLENSYVLTIDSTGDDVPEYMFKDLLTGKDLPLLLTPKYLDQGLTYYGFVSAGSVPVYLDLLDTAGLVYTDLSDEVTGMDEIVSDFSKGILNHESDCSNTECPYLSTHAMRDMVKLDRSQDISPLQKFLYIDILLSPITSNALLESFVKKAGHYNTRNMPSISKLGSGGKLSPDMLEGFLKSIINPDDE